MHNAAPFRGTDRLKFTADDQDLIRSAERMRGYRREQPSSSGFARLLVRLLVWTLSTMFLALVVVAAISSSYGTLSRALAVLIQRPAAEVGVPPLVKDDRAPTSPGQQGIDHQATISAGMVLVAPAASSPEAEGDAVGEQEPDSEATVPELPSQAQIPEHVEGERRVEFATMDEAVTAMRERGYIDDVVRHVEQQDWTEVGVEKETLLLREPRFDGPILGRLVPGSRYWVIDTQLQCSQLVDLTWKLARIRVTSTQFDEGLVCTPNRDPESPTSGSVSFTGPDGGLIFTKSR